MSIRILQAADLPGVLAIEQEAMTDPWNERQLAAELDVDSGIGLVAEQDGRIRGYAFFRICAPESELLRLAVGREWRQQGVGSQLLAHALSSFAREGYTTCFLEVRAANAAARRLYEKASFLQVGIRKKYYQQPVDDALLLCRNLTDLKEGTH